MDAIRSKQISDRFKKHDAIPLRCIINKNPTLAPIHQTVVIRHLMDHILTARFFHHCISAAHNPFGNILPGAFRHDFIQNQKIDIQLLDIRQFFVCHLSGLHGNITGNVGCFILKSGLINDSQFLCIIRINTCCHFRCDVR